MNSFGAERTLRVQDRAYDICSLSALERAAGVDLGPLPYTVRILLENLLRSEDGVNVTHDDVLALARYRGDAVARREISFRPARVVLQDFTGVPALVDLAAMRDALAELGGDPSRADPQVPVELVIDHSVQVDAWASKDAERTNTALEMQRNRERYVFLRWGQTAFHNFVVAPPDAGIVHQVNLEHLARVVFTSDDNPRVPRAGRPLAYPDTLVGTDSHTPMVNGLGVLGWGVGGIEAEAAMLGESISMLVPHVLGIRLHGELRPGTTATDLVLTITERLRKHGVVGKFVEFFGPGVAKVPLADRATIGNMSPEYGATCAVFPIDDVTLEYLRLTNRPAWRVSLVEAYAKEQGLFHSVNAPQPAYSEVLELDLGTVEPSIAGPRKPQERVPLREAKARFAEAMKTFPPSARASTMKEHSLSLAPAHVGVWGEAPLSDAATGLDGARPRSIDEGLRDGAIVIAALTSCTNTSNPAVMLAAGLLAKRAVERGLEAAPWVKTSLAPGSRVVTDYYEAAGLTPYLEKLGFQVVGYGCTTCIGNSGPLAPEIAHEIDRENLVVCSVLSGNRNFEGRIHSLVRANYLMSPPLVVAYAIAGRMDVDLTTEPLGVGKDGKPVFLRDLWPSADEVAKLVATCVRKEMFAKRYADIFKGDALWESLQIPTGSLFSWDASSTYVRRPPYFDGMSRTPRAHVDDVTGARVLAVLGDAVTTDHISPAGSIKASSPAGLFLVEHGVDPKDFNSYGSRRGNHEVMVRGTFANVRIRNRLVPEVEGGFTKYLPTGEVLSIYDAAMRYRDDGTPLVVLAGKEYGSGSSRDWAAKGAALLGVHAVLAESFERIHRSNLIGMGVLPLQFQAGTTVASLGLDGRETFDLVGVDAALADAQRTVHVRARREDGTTLEFDVVARIDTPAEAAQFRHGGILPFVVRRMLGVVASTEQASASAVATSRPSVVLREGAVEEGSIESFPASDSPAY